MRSMMILTPRRGALANASILGFKEDLNLDTTKYNLVATVFLFTYSLFDIPSNWILQKSQLLIPLFAALTTRSPPESLDSLHMLRMGLRDHHVGSRTQLCGSALCPPCSGYSRGWILRASSSSLHFRSANQRSRQQCSSLLYGTHARTCSGECPSSTAWAPSLAHLPV